MKNISKGLIPSILIFGPPGSGKGTQGRFLQCVANLYHLSSGEIFRGLSSDSKEGRLYQEFASKGHLVPDDLTIEIWYNFVQSLITNHKYSPEKQYLLLDGIPRTAEQLQLMQKYIKVDAIIHLKIQNQNALIERMQKRAVIEKREDDMNVDVLQTRFTIYQERTESILSLFPKDIIYTFDAEQKPLEVFRDILQKLCPILS